MTHYNPCARLREIQLQNVYCVFVIQASSQTRDADFSESPEQMKLQGLIMHHVFGQPVHRINQSIDDSQSKYRI